MTELLDLTTDRVQATTNRGTSDVIAKEQSDGDRQIGSCSRGHIGSSRVDRPFRKANSSPVTQSISLWNDHSCSSSHRAVDLKEVMAMNLRRKRHDQHMTQEELAERAGLSTRYVGAIERGDVSASVTVLGQIAEALGVEPGELLRRSSRKG
jgi:DNA-binding XRE family transcriptional regulator